MTKTRRILSFGQGIFLLAFALMLVVFPEGALPVIAGLFGIGMTLRGLGTLLYYFRMARFMVGGKRVLYTGLIFLDFGIFTAALYDTVCPCSCDCCIPFPSVCYGCLGLCCRTGLFCRGEDI